MKKIKQHPNTFATFLPVAWTSVFDVTKIEELDNEWRVTLTEKENCIPEELHGKDVVLNGYLPILELVDFPLRGKLLYLHFVRRRWKEAGGTVSYQNPDYQFHPEGAKVTYDFGNFLKGLTRDEFDEFCLVWPSVRDCWEEDRCLVS